MTTSLRFIAALFAMALTSIASAEAITEFRATINAAGAIASDGSISTETRMTGLATFTLTVPDIGSPTLTYDIVFQGIDLGSTDADPTNNATAIHFHDTTGVAYSASTPHVLNVFGFPSQDDNQTLVDATTSRVTGVWDDSDLTDPGLAHAGNPAVNSDTLTASLDALLASELYVMLHTSSPNALPLSPGITIGGQIVPIPEPSTMVLAAFLGVVACSRRALHG